MEATIALITPRADTSAASLCAAVRDVARLLADRLSGGRARLLVADIDQSPLLGNGVNETRPDAFAAAIVFEAPTTASDPAREPELDALGVCRSYRTQRRAVKDGGTTRSPGEDTPGFAMVSPVFRAPAMSHEQFDAHWRDRHAPLALRHHIGMWRYDQYAVAETLTADAPAFDGVAMLYFASVEDYEKRLFDSDAGRNIIMADTARFLDLARSEAALMRETILRSEP